MKRLNRKGFTLVELLAVIVILAIVVGITLVTVLPTLKKSRQEAFELTAQTAADYIEKIYQLYMIGEDIPEALESSWTGALFRGGSSLPVAGLKEAGLKPENYVKATYRVDTTTGRACVTLIASTNTSVSHNIFNMAGEKAAGEYYDAEEIDTAKQIFVYFSASAVQNDSYQPFTYKYSEAKSSGCN